MCNDSIRKIHTGSSDKETLLGQHPGRATDILTNRVGIVFAKDVLTDRRNLVMAETPENDFVVLIFSMRKEGFFEDIKLIIISSQMSMSSELRFSRQPDYRFSMFYPRAKKNSSQSLSSQ